MLESLDLWFGANAPWLDTLALFVVCGIALKRKDIIAAVVLAEFSIVYFGQNWLKGLEIWGSIGLDYQYVLGIKDVLIALTLILLAASPWLTAAYIFPSLLSWLLFANYAMWGSKSIEGYTNFLVYYYAWSPLYCMAMPLQIFGLSQGGDDAGKLIRRKIIPVDMGRILQPVYRLAYYNIAMPNFKTASL